MHYKGERNAVPLFWLRDHVKLTFALIEHIAKITLDYTDK
jgi:hypothetical protein